MGAAMRCDSHNPLCPGLRHTTSLVGPSVWVPGDDDDHNDGTSLGPLDTRTLGDRAAQGRRIFRGG